MPFQDLTLIGGLASMIYDIANNLKANPGTDTFNSLMLKVEASCAHTLKMVFPIKQETPGSLQKTLEIHRF